MGWAKRAWQAAHESVLGYRRLLGAWPLASLIVGTFLNSLTGGVVNLLLSIHVYQVTGSSPVAVSMLFLITWLPNSLVAPISSGLADRYNRRRFLAVCGLVRAVLCLALLAHPGLVAMLLLAFALTSVGALMKPARYALAAQLTRGPDRAVLNSLLTMVVTVAGILSGALTGLLSSLTGGLAFALAAGISLLAASFDLARSREVPPGQVEALEDQVDSDSGTTASASKAGPKMAQAARLIWQQPILRNLTVVSTLLWLGLGMQEPLLLVFTTTVLHGTDATYAYLNAVGSIGALLGAALAAPLGSQRARALRSFALSLLFSGLIFGVFAGNRQLGFAFLLFFLFNASYGVANVIDDLLEQDLSPNHLRARVISLVGAVATVGYLIGGGCVGFVAQQLGASWAAAISASVIGTSGVLALFTMVGRSTGENTKT